MKEYERKNKCNNHAELVDRHNLGSISELERLTQPESRAKVQAEMQESMSTLGHGGAAAKAAEAVLSLFEV